jgi:hypothetical protein
MLPPPRSAPLLHVRASHGDFAQSGIRTRLFGARSLPILSRVSSISRANGSCSGGLRACPGIVAQTDPRPVQPSRRSAFATGTHPHRTWPSYPVARLNPSLLPSPLAKGEFLRLSGSRRASFGVPRHIPGHRLLSERCHRCCNLWSDCTRTPTPIAKPELLYPETATPKST